MKAFLVLGPESSGTRLMTSLLMAAGCYGDDDHEQRLDGGRIPDNEPLLVWRRSVPHRGQWPRIDSMIRALEDYQVTTIVMSRDWHSMAISQEQAPHAPDAQTALRNIRHAYKHIFSYELGRLEMVNYEALTQRPQTVQYLFHRLGLPVPAVMPEIYDGNARYYQ